MRGGRPICTTDIFRRGCAGVGQAGAAGWDGLCQAALQKCCKEQGLLSCAAFIRTVLPAETPERNESSGFPSSNTEECQGHEAAQIARGYGLEDAAE